MRTRGLSVGVKVLSAKHQALLWAQMDNREKSVYGKLRKPDAVKLLPGNRAKRMRF